VYRPRATISSISVASAARARRFITRSCQPWV
jgi:hypothetical protein